MRHEEVKKILFEKNEELKRLYNERKPLINFIHEIIEMRYKKNLSQEDLANILGTSRTNISRIERGKQNLSYKMMFKIVSALGGDLFITAKGNDVIKLTDESKKVLETLLKRYNKPKEQIIEVSLKMLLERIRSYELSEKVSQPEIEGYIDEKIPELEDELCLLS
ncbi:helix-turn-helix transcriptional regulator [Thermosipho ferrireducens]|uniref:Helix-turn-helix transcriptional regulator n=1 Tax=Thermosipho ferrireducens TaxID=2571116 RepID=A0ABX7S7E2_9BACT|nr:helix-turn-helix transcriptional regulator [Thermosipho ferrireducens]QTA38516.1 helix-turn-helix transcriptional regulator [Thermosipho ferrireducens]